tara:strand:+ start:17001 stop:17366 length:366 start_codon:yes stop_codon:yes gene_type:complete
MHSNLELIEKSNYLNIFTPFITEKKVYKVFSAENNAMNSGFINDTPKNALILSEKVALKEHKLIQSSYGYVFELENSEFIFRDVENVFDKVIEVSVREIQKITTINKALVKNIYKVIKRTF